MHDQLSYFEWNSQAEPELGVNIRVFLPSWQGTCEARTATSKSPPKAARTMAEGLPLNLPDFAAVHDSGYGRFVAKVFCTGDQKFFWP
jgi:hypothetical protein